jgi:hypothetical protein
MKYKAKILPLDGKYYGTEIKVETHDDSFDITVWWMGDFTPSDRELKQCGMSLDEWHENDMGCDSHFESSDGLEVAEIITKALNQTKEDK